MTRPNDVKRDLTRPTNGCVLLHQLKHNGQFIPGFNQTVHKAFGYAQQRLKHERIPAFLDTTERTKGGEALDFTFMKPPFPEQWVEICVGGMRQGYYVMCVEHEGHDRVEITGYQPGGRQCPDKPQGCAAVHFKLDKQGSGTILHTHHVFSHIPEAEDRAWQHQMAFICVRVLQTMAAINVGFFEVRDPREDDKSLPRAQRRGFIGQRYHILTLRTAADIRANRKIVMNPGSMPLNTARGHWARYGIDGRGLLFGKYAGRYWIPPHARGRAENGVVHKDYKLATDERRVAS